MILVPRSPNPKPCMQDPPTLTLFPIWEESAFLLSLPSNRNQPPPCKALYSLSYSFRLFIKRLRTSTSNCLFSPRQLSPRQGITTAPVPAWNATEEKKHSARHRFNHLKRIILPHEPPKHRIRKEALSLAADKHIPQRSTPTSSRTDPGPLPACGPWRSCSPKPLS